MWNRYPKGSHKTWATSVQLSGMMKLKIEFAKNKCLGTIWSTETNPIA